MLGKLSSDGVTIKAVDQTKWKSEEQKTCSIDCHADKSVSNYAGVEKYEQTPYVNIQVVPKTE